MAYRPIDFVPEFGNETQINYLRLLPFAGEEYTYLERRQCDCPHCDGCMSICNNCGMDFGDEYFMSGEVKVQTPIGILWADKCPRCELLMFDEGDNSRIRWALRKLEEELKEQEKQKNLA